MSYEIAALIKHSNSVAEICAGAFGYLSAATDEYLHSDNVTLEAFHQDFHRLQTEVSAGLQHHFESQGTNMADAAHGVRNSARALGLPEEHVDVVVRKALKLIYPNSDVIEP